MAISNYSDLQQSIANFIGKDNLASMLPDFIALAEARIASDITTNELHTTTTLAVSSQTASLPNDFKGMIRINIGTERDALSYVPPDTFHSINASNQVGEPITFTIEGNTIYFAPTPDTAYTVDYTYIAKPDLQTDTTNRLLTINPNIYLFASLCEAADYLQDNEAYSKYESRYRQAIDSLNESDSFKGILTVKLDGIV